MAKAVSWESYRNQISGLSALDYNYDAATYYASKSKQGWNIDHYFANLATEAAGPPVADGAFEKTKNALSLYQFPNPSLIVAWFDPAQALAKRNMLMKARFAGMTFTFGVRVVAVVDEIRKNDVGQEIQAWGYSYRTLRGHFEIGEIRFEATKNFATGAVDVVIDAYSKPDRIPNFFFRAGFRIFGRRLQKYFAESSIQRLQKIARA